MLWLYIVTGVYSQCLLAYQWSEDICGCIIIGPLFIKRMDVLPQDLVKSRSCEIGCYNDPIVLKIDMHLGSAAAEVDVTFQNDCKNLILNLVASRLHEILW